MPVSERTYLGLALEDPEGQWELHRGCLRQKPGMTAEHNYIATQLLIRLAQQLDRREFDLRTNAGHLRRSSENYYIPDLFVVPMELVQPLRHRSDVLETYSLPLPLVIEIWSPSTGDYDVDTKLPEYQQRGDLEIWRIHPYERTLTAWRREPDGGYSETVYAEGVVRPVALQNVVIELEALFD